MSGAVLDAVIAVNMIVDLIMRFREVGIEVTPENIGARIKELESRADANDQKLGIYP